MNVWIKKTIHDKGNFQFVGGGVGVGHFRGCGGGGLYSARHNSLLTRPDGAVAKSSAGMLWFKR